MYGKIFLLLLLVSLCLAQDPNQDIARKRHKHKFHLHHHGIYYYLAFLAVKVKVVFLIGSLISFWMFAGKLFGILKYGFSNFKASEPEKIFVQPTHPTFYGTTGGSYFDHDTSERGDYDTNKYYDNGGKYSRGLEGGVYDTIDTFRNIIGKFDLNGYAFDSMDIKTEECRRKFVCEAEYKASKHPLLKLGMRMINDNSLDKYRTTETIKALEECSSLYPGCDNILPSADR